MIKSRYNNLSLWQKGFSAALLTRILFIIHYSILITIAGTIFIFNHGWLSLILLVFFVITWIFILCAIEDNICWKNEWYDIYETWRIILMFPSLIILIIVESLVFYR